MLAYYRSCGQSGDYPEGQIYQQQINRKHRPALLNPKNPAPLIGKKNKNSASSGARTYRKPTRYSRFQAVFINSPNRMPHSPPQKSGL